MRSSKSRSRNKSNRNRSSVGNIVNRVFDSSGPEGKVRGTPQQIIEKYNQLARDAQLSNDRVATENFQQHAEHYTRMLADAQREQDAKREQQEQENRQRQAERDRDRSARQEREGNNGQNGDQPQPNQQPQRQSEKQPQPQAQPAPKDDSQPKGDVLGVVGGETVGEDTGLVETPEDKPAKRSGTRKPRAPRTKKPADADKAKDSGGNSDGGEGDDPAKTAAE